MPIKVKVFGGDVSFTGALSSLNLETPEVNGEIYDNWASSVKDFPEVTDQKVHSWLYLSVGLVDIKTLFC